MNVEQTAGQMGSKGGKAAAANMTAEERQDRATKAAETRWNSTLPRATHAGVLRLGSVEINCVVLEDGRRLLNQENLLKAIGRSGRPKGGTGIQGKGKQLDDLPSFLRQMNLKSFIDKDLRNSTSPISYLSLANKRTFGFLGEVLPGTCRVYLDAERAGKILKGQINTVAACRVLYESLADVAIIALIDEATGYQYERPRLELQEFLAMYINKKLAAWERTFPPEFYSEIYRLKGWKFDPTTSARTPEVGKITNDLIYARLAPFVLEELKRITPKDAKGRRKHKFFQRLTKDPGVKELRDHFREVFAVSRGHDEWVTFYRHMNRSLPLQAQHPDLFSHLPYPPDTLPTASQPPALQMPLAAQVSS